MRKFLLLLLLAVGLCSQYVLAQTSPTVRVNSIAELVAVKIPTITTAFSAIVAGYYNSTNSGPTRTFIYNAESTLATNRCRVFKPLVGNGRWIDTDIGPINVMCCGAKGDGITDDYQAIVSAINTATNVFVPTGKFLVSQILHIPSNFTIQGSSSSSSSIEHDFDITDNGLLSVSGKTNVTIQSITLNGHKTSGLHFGDLIRVIGPSSEIRIRDCTFLNARNSAILMWGLVTNFTIDHIVAQWEPGNSYANTVGVALEWKDSNQNLVSSGIVSDVTVLNGFQGLYYSAPFGIETSDFVARNVTEGIVLYAGDNGPGVFGCNFNNLDVSVVTGGKGIISDPYSSVTSTVYTNALNNFSNVSVTGDGINRAIAFYDNTKLNNVFSMTCDEQHSSFYGYGIDLRQNATTVGPSGNTFNGIKMRGKFDRGVYFTGATNNLVSDFTSIGNNYGIFLASESDRNVFYRAVFQSNQYAWNVDSGVSNTRFYDFLDQGSVNASVSGGSAPFLNVITIMSPVGNYLTKFTTTNQLSESIVYDNGTNVGIGITNAGTKLDVVGRVQSRTSASGSFNTISIIADDGTHAQIIADQGGGASAKGLAFNVGGSDKLQLETDGSVVIPDVGGRFKIKEGSNASMGTATLVAGAVTVNNTSVTANSRIFLTSQVDGGTPGFLRVDTRTASTSFHIQSSNVLDTSTVAWVMFDPSP